jgi:hypothetical protein
MPGHSLRPASLSVTVCSVCHDGMYLEASPRELADLHPEWWSVCLACLLPAEPRLRPAVDGWAPQ